MPSSDTQFKPGQSGNPDGRPKGHRNKLSESFIRVLCEDFEANGQDVIAKLRDEQPAQYVNVIAKLMPRLMELTGKDGNSLQAERVEWTVLPVTPIDRINEND